MPAPVLNMSKVIPHRLEEWTPDQAATALANQPLGQRPVNQRTVWRLLSDFRSGNWYPEVATPVSILDNGAVINGTAVLTMISRLPAGTKVKIYVTRNLPFKIFRHIEFNQVSRSWGDVLRYLYPEAKADALNVAAGVVHLMSSYRGPGTLPDFKAKARGWDEMAGFFETWHEQLIDAAQWAQTISRKDDVQPGAITRPKHLAFVLFLLHEHEDAPRFFQAMVERDGLSPDDPRAQLLKHYSLPAYDIPCRRRRGSDLVSTIRVAELLGVWKAYQEGTDWKPWDGTESGFAHPPIGFADELGWEAADDED